MKVKVQLMVAGKLFNEIVNAANYHDAQQVALALSLIHISEPTRRM